VHWSWETNPADRISAIIHEVHCTWDGVENNEALRDEIRVFMKSKMDLSTYLHLCEKPAKGWYDEITKMWRIVKNKEPVERDSNIKLVNNIRLMPRLENGNDNEGVMGLNAWSEKTYQKDERRPGKRCPRCRGGIHFIQNCPLPRKRGKGSKNRNKIKRQKLRITVNKGKRGERRVACLTERSMPNGMWHA